MIYQLLLSSRSKYHNSLQRESQQTFQPGAEISNVQAHWDHYKQVCKEWADSKRSCNNLLIEFSINEETGEVMVTRTHHKTFPVQQRIEVNKPMKDYLPLTTTPKNTIIQGGWVDMVALDGLSTTEIPSQNTTT